MPYKALPTTDLYFLGSMGDLVSGVVRRAQVTRIGDNSFRVGSRYLVVRRDRDEVVDRILSDQAAEIIYLIDDDLSAADDPSLPEGYRERLAALKAGQYRKLLDRAALVVASSDKVAAGLSTKADIRTLHPYWAGTLRTGKHLTAKAGPLDLVHLGTGSHGAGFDFLKPVIESLLAGGADIRFHYYGNEPRLGALDDDPRIVRHGLKSWRRYKAALGRRHFHLGLYPLPDTPFNAGRSINKILEYTLAGCPAIYSADWGRARDLVHGENAFLAEDTVEAWGQAVRDIVAERDRLPAVYEGAAAHYRRFNDRDAQRLFWLETLVGGNL
ncbi:hypothetical protein [Kordiimonas marina]|uniref:hypothetical protein n=1 Tax=Kordiimonas marina TaxID=2872312 RepID=UPI001FF5BD84|nr:hypothetical protein [Kordiimonas marina]MCJ9429764.1 hypothetical protein [Kordiimonas marina]